jgi:hypothetical protein
MSTEQEGHSAFLAALQFPGYPRQLEQEDRDILVPILCPELAEDRSNETPSQKLSDLAGLLARMLIPLASFVFEKKRKPQPPSLDGARIAVGRIMSYGEIQAPDSELGGKLRLDIAVYFSRQGEVEEIHQVIPYDGPTERLCGEDHIPEDEWERRLRLKTVPVLLFWQGGFRILEGYIGSLDIRALPKKGR